MEITGQLHIPDSELRWSFVRAGGPGGQNVNKVASKAVLRWNLASNSSLPEDVRDRLRVQQRGRITAEGELVLNSDRFRDQQRNRRDCLEKLRALVLRALYRPRPRKATRPSRAAKERRLQAKRHQARRKAERRTPAREE
ncbi:MAG TPA: alternative ribosome rescue aminoacyl-tRNA hydrolase ArfB [Gemmataceae bacterium]|jgi:ribosome-associated protein|nr:alternative ribosome rescue aminoacyl-tRNA hydrolase ArfB [Gemmataceae bacterium]